MSIKNNDSSMVAHFFYHRKNRFQVIGHYGALVVTTLLIGLAVALVVGMTAASLSRPGLVATHPWMGGMCWSGSGCFASMLMAMAPLFLCVGVNGILLLRLFCAYKKNHIFSAENSRTLVLLGLLNVFFCHAVLGLFCLILSVALPDKDSA